MFWLGGTRTTPGQTTPPLIAVRAIGAIIAAAERVCNSLEPEYAE
jgi:hypothetical protein